jgi:hypothetical protein
MLPSFGIPASYGACVGHHEALQRSPVRASNGSGWNAAQQKMFEGLFAKLRSSQRDANEEKYAAWWLEQIDLYEKHCIEMELIASAATIRKIRKVLTEPGPAPTEIIPLIIELSGRLFDEMNGRVFWAYHERDRVLQRSPQRVGGNY